MKRRLREEMLKKRAALAQAVVLEKSILIKQRLFTSSWYQDAQTILFYVSYNNEVNTHAMIQESLIHGKNVIVPKTDTRNKTLILSKLSCWNDLCPGTYTILEPRDDRIQVVSIQSIDLCIIPGVVFDCRGNRIGYGGGYYDQLLQTRCHAHRIGLAFELQIIDNIPAEKHDVHVERILTEERTITCS